MAHIYSSIKKKKKFNRNATHGRKYAKIYYLDNIWEGLVTL